MNTRQYPNDEASIRILAEAVSRAIGENKDNKRFIDMDRIPLICLSITGIHGTLERIEGMIKEDRENFLTKESFTQQFWPVKAIVIGFVSMVLVAFASAVIASYVINKDKPSATLLTTPPISHGQV